MCGCVLISSIKAPLFVPQDKEAEAQRQRGEDMDVMLTEKDRKLAEKEAFIVHLQTSLAGDQPVPPALQQKVIQV